LQAVHLILDLLRWTCYSGRRRSRRLRWMSQSQRPCLKLSWN